MPKIIRTYSVDKQLYTWFDIYAKKVSLNKSGFISRKIEELKEQIDKQQKEQETKQQENS